MSSASPPHVLVLARQRIVPFLPAAVAVATCTWVGIHGLVHPLSLALCAAWGASLLLMACLRAPIVLFALFPLTMLWFVDAPVEPFDLALVTLATVSVLPILSRPACPILRPRGIALWYSLFLLCLLTTLAAPFNATRLIAVTKMYVIGLVAYGVARYGASRFGRRPLVWGLVLFAGATDAMLILRHAASGVGAGQIMSRRTLLTDLSWGTSNYVAAVLVALLPTALYLLRSPDAGRNSRRLGVAAFATQLAGVLYTTSRGGFLLALGTLLYAMRGTWKVPWKLVLGSAAALAMVLFTPLGVGILGRFSDPQGIFSIAARWAVWGAAWERGVTNLPFGIGHGQGLVHGDKLGDIDPHNFPLTLFSEGGPLALLLWLTLMAAVWRRGRALAGSPGTRAAGQSLALLAVLAFLNSLFEPTFPGYFYHTLFWWSVGVFDAAGPEPGPRTALPSAP